MRWGCAFEGQNGDSLEGWTRCMAREQSVRRPRSDSHAVGPRNQGGKERGNPHSRAKRRDNEEVILVNLVREGRATCGTRRRTQRAPPRASPPATRRGV
jgi:hypothetical protein